MKNYLLNPQKEIWSLLFDYYNPFWGGNLYWEQKSIFL